MGTVNLPLSKSIINRVLIIKALSGFRSDVPDVFNSDDTEIMRKALHSKEMEINAGDAGTVMRFLTAYYAQAEGVRLLSGSQRMQERPVGVLVEALRKLGAKIVYLGQEGFPPLQIFGAPLSGGTVALDASVSSQYISALMLIAPYMSQGLKIEITEKAVSSPYIYMTGAVMKAFGAEVEIADRVISVRYKPYGDCLYRIERDWSAASYFYELLAVAEEGVLELKGLSRESVQGDSGQAAIWKSLGVTTEYAEEGIILRKTDCTVSELVYDFTAMPDVVPSFVVACCLKGIPFDFSGIKTLRIKECDRVAVLQEELLKLGYRLEIAGENRLIWRDKRGGLIAETVMPHGDHRIAMAFAPARIMFRDLVIADKAVVKKSFPDYFRELSRLTGDWGDTSEEKDKN